MAEFPFQLLIKRTYPEKRTERLLCTALLRVIPGRRKVYDAMWNDKSVIAKVFSHKIIARRHLKREWQGLNLLQRRGLSSPAPLFYGHTEDGRWAVVVQKIADSSTVLDVFQETLEPAKKLDLLVLVCKELAKQHNKGVLQKDLHLGNFLLGGDKVFALDTGQMRFSRRELDRKNSIPQLAMLASCLPDTNTESISMLCKEYFKARGWHFGKPDESSFQKQLAVHRKRTLRKGLKKCLRTSKRYLRIKADRYIAVFDRAFCPKAEPLNFIKQIDAMMDEGQILKKGDTCYVSRITWNDKDVVVKRYNHKGFIHSLRHTIKRSRARRSWLHGHRLVMLDIATPKPLAYIEQRKGKLVWRSYIVTEYVEGQKLYNFLRDDNITEQRRLNEIQRVVKLFDKLWKYRITHGDLKHSNILITDNCPVLTDLDGMKVHKWTWIYKHRRRKDLRRFSKQLSPSFVSKTI
ncbi:MAG: protein kinase [Planctomycetes bacterium]|nr:protein kinase [Planctomycetota bacterium]